VLLALGVGAAGDDLAVVVDRGGVVEGEPGAGRDQSALGTTRSFIPLPM
jgi:hypothetical protein